MNARLYRGGQPDEAGLAALKALGIRTILDLRGVDAIPAIEREQARVLGLRYVRISHGNLIAPTRQAMDRALAILADPEAWPVYVHCRRGCDRTGTVIACYRVSRESWTAERAIAEARALGMHRSEVFKRRFIRRFHRRQHADTVRGQRSGSPAEAGACESP